MNANLNFLITSHSIIDKKVLTSVFYDGQNHIIIFDSYDFELASDEQIEKAIINYFMDNY